MRGGVLAFFVIGVPLAIYQISTHEGDWETPWAAYAKEVGARLGPYGGTDPPGGRPPSGAYEGEPQQAPGTPTPAPAHDPSTGESAQAPGKDPTQPAEAPGPQGGEALEAPGVVDDPDECHRLIVAGTPHKHHIFPQTLKEYFARIGINIHRYTISIPAKQHIGPNGLHSALNWNDHWHVFFDDIPTGPLTEDQMKKWEGKAKDLAMDLLHQAGMAHLPHEWY
jgi:hypothetical protein